MSKSNGDPNEQLNPCFGNNDAVQEVLMPPDCDACSAHFTTLQERLRQSLRREDELCRLNDAAHERIRELEEQLLPAQPPAALNAPGSDDATGSTTGRSRRNRGLNPLETVGHEAMEALMRQVRELEDANHLLFTGMERIMAQRDELQRRLSAVNQPNLTGADEAVLLAALSSRARELGERAGVWCRTELTESTEAELKRTRAAMRDLMTITSKLLPGVAYLVASEFDTECVATSDRLDFGVGGEPVPPPPAKEDIPW